jgi:plastocyanin
MKRLIALIAAVALCAALAVPALAATKTVSLRDNVFSPKSVTVKKNTRVKFSWKGSNPHNVTATKGPVKFHSSTKTSGSYSRKMTRRGSYTIVCTIHPGMTMKLRVTS